MTVTKSELVNLLSDATGLTKVDVEVIVNGLLYHIMEALQNGDRVEIRGFGSFYAKERLPRKVKNPQMGREIEVDHRFVPVFKPAKFFRESVNNSLRKKYNIGESTDENL
ncbi:MAG: HU family DNA-binding protein [Calditrichaeota bacterium]|nr:HU family DNA-binding protein [Calditrichota bacterium]